MKTNRVAVIAHNRKTLGGGSSTSSAQRCARPGVDDPLWIEFPKSKKAPAAVRKALDVGVDLIFVWGGDGTVQRSIDTIVGSDVPLAILPAGTANLLAANLGIPKDLAKAVDIGLNGVDKRIDTGRINR